MTFSSIFMSAQGYRPTYHLLRRLFYAMRNVSQFSA